MALLLPPGTPAAAKQEVKKLLHAKGVRKTIADGILARILDSAPAPAAVAMAAEIPLPGDEIVSNGGSRSGAVTPATEDIDVVLVSFGMVVGRKIELMAGR